MGDRIKDDFDAFLRKVDEVEYIVKGLALNNEGAMQKADSALNEFSKVDSAAENLGVNRYVFN